MLYNYFFLTWRELSFLKRYTGQATFLDSLIVKRENWSDDTWYYRWGNTSFSALLWYYKQEESRALYL